jgi:hypothetical protein
MQTWLGKAAADFIQVHPPLIYQIPFIDMGFEHPYAPMPKCGVLCMAGSGPHLQIPWLELVMSIPMH